MRGTLSSYCWYLVHFGTVTPSLINIQLSKKENKQVILNKQVNLNILKQVNLNGWLYNQVLWHAELSSHI